MVKKIMVILAIVCVWSLAAYCGRAILEVDNRPAYRPSDWR